MKKINAYAPASQEGLLLNANELSLNFSEAIRKELKEAIDTIPFNRYPDPEETELLEAYGKVIGFAPDHLLAGNGSDQMLGYLIGTYLGKGKKLFTLDPDFSMYDYYASSYEAEVVRFQEREDGSYDVNEFIEAGRKVRPDMILFSNPNNPGGQCLSTSEVEKILQAFPDIPVAVDEAYIEFSNIRGSEELIDRYDNLFITRTLSKALGAAGLRVGFLIGSKKRMADLKKNFVPYALNRLSMKAAVIALRHRSEYEPVIELIKKEREKMYEAARGLQKVTLYPSNGNFLRGRVNDKELLLSLFAREKIVIRNYDNPYYFRISIGLPEENNRVWNVLKTYEEEAI
jgi:histidinol-phosphate aminotransferase